MLLTDVHDCMTCDATGSRLLDLYTIMVKTPVYPGYKYRLSSSGWPQSFVWNWNNAFWAVCQGLYPINGVEAISVVSEVFNLAFGPTLIGPKFLWIWQGSCFAYNSLFQNSQLEKGDPGKQTRWKPFVPTVG
jgi:hypothetical protein